MSPLTVLQTIFLKLLYLFFVLGWPNFLKQESIAPLRVVNR